MFQASDRWKRVPAYSQSFILMSAMALIGSLTALPTPSPAATTISHPIRGVLAITIKASPVRIAAARVHPRPAVAELADFTNNPTPGDGYVVTLIHQDFPARAWHAAEAVAWCESKFRTTDIGFDSNGTHDRGLFQLNDGGTEQYLMSMIGQNPKNLNLAFNPALNVRAAALLYARDGWSQWSCASAI
jgi:Transglycosylase SLT domain